MTEAEIVEALKLAILSRVADMAKDRLLEDVSGCVAEAADEVRAEVEAGRHA